MRPARWRSSTSVGAAHHGRWGRRLGHAWSYARKCCPTARDGLITEFDVAEALLRHQIAELVEAAGARTVHLIEQPLAAAASRTSD